MQTKNLKMAVWCCMCHTVALYSLWIQKWLCRLTYAFFCKMQIEPLPIMYPQRPGETVCDVCGMTIFFIVQFSLFMCYCTWFIMLIWSFCPFLIFVQCSFTWRQDLASILRSASFTILSTALDLMPMKTRILSSLWRLLLLAFQGEVTLLDYVTGS